MISKDLISLLRSLSKKEFSQFTDYLSSPYCVSNEKLRPLFLYIGKNFDRVQDLSSQEIFKALYPARQYNKSTIQNLYSDLSKACEDFLVINSLRTTKNSKEERLLEEYLNRNLSRQFKKLLIKTQSQITESGLLPETYSVRNSILTHEMNFKITYDKNISQKDAIERLKLLDKSALFSTIHYFTNLIKLFYKFKLYEDKFNLDHGSGILSGILNSFNLESIMMATQNNKHAGLVALYTNLYKLLISKTHGKYLNIYRESFERYADKLHKYEQGFHMSILINYYVNEMNRFYFDQDTRRNLFNLYRKLIDRQLYRSRANDFLHRDLFRAIIIVALNLKEFKWAKEFIENNSALLHKKDRMSMYNLGLFLYFGHTNNPGESLNYLSKLTLDNFIHRYDEHLMKIRIFFELNMLFEAEQCVHSFEEFLRKNEMESKARKKKYLMFLQTVRKLIAAKLEKNSNELDFVRHKLTDQSDIIFKDWLLEKLGSELLVA